MAFLTVYCKNFFLNTVLIFSYKTIYMGCSLPLRESSLLCLSLTLPKIEHRKYFQTIKWDCREACPV